MLEPTNKDVSRFLVEADWLENHLNDSDILIIDATVQVKLWPFPRVVSGKYNFNKRHIPGAIFADLLKISDPNSRKRTFTMPHSDHFEYHMSRLGIDENKKVVIYDERENMWAARLWWMLKTFGFNNAVILNGGWHAWVMENRPQTRKLSQLKTTNFKSNYRPELIADKEDVLKAIDERTTCIISALGRRQHMGLKNEYGRRGHIPGAKNVTAWEILDRSTKKYKPAEELMKLFEPMFDQERIITYCGGGVAASSDAFVLSMLGHRNVAVYDGGLMEWCKDNQLPLEVET